MKHVWKIVVRRHPDEADRRQGYVLVEKMGEALDLAEDPDAVAIPQPLKMWPGAPGECVSWSN